MVHILLVIIYPAFISLGPPDSLLGSAWPVMHLKFCVPISWAGTCLMPPLFGVPANALSVRFMPFFYLLALPPTRPATHEQLNRR